MSDHLSDPPPYEPPPPEEDFYEWENEDEGPGHNVLWTRIVALIVGLLLVFFLGRLTAGGDDGGDDAELTSLRQQNSQLEGRVTDLQNELEAAHAEEAPEATETPAEGEEEGGGNTGGSTETYTVQAGQGFQQIAEDALGDIGLAECIAEFNGLTLESTITPGEELDIPAAEDC
jgi:hypothetical protein